MESALASYPAPGAPVVFQDALGERRRLDTPGADAAEVLCLRSELSGIPSFEFALRERASRLAAFRHTYFGRVRGVDRLSDPGGTLAVVSDHTRGVRLSALLSENGPRPVTIDVTLALHFLRQLVSAVSMLHESARNVAHGAIGPERIVVTPNARIVVVEYMLGAALEQLRFSRDRYWRELRIALPPAPGLPRFDHRADITQIGAVGLSLILGRLLREDEYIAHGSELLASASTIPSKGGGLEPLPAGLRSWLTRALQLDARQSFASALEARPELEKILATAHEEPTSLSLRSVERATVVADAPEIPAEKFPAEKVPADKMPVAVRAEDDHPKAVFREHAAPPVADEPIPSLQGLKLSPRSRYIAAAALVGAVLVAGGAYSARRMFAAPAPIAVAMGTLTISSNPMGSQVRVDGVARGVTPLNLALKAGPHQVEIRGAGEPRTVPVTITAGTQVTQYIELPAATPTATGQLQIRTEPAGAQVSVDGVLRGRSPLFVEGLAPGDHVVGLESELGAVKHTVNVVAATTASLVVPMAGGDRAPVSGWVSVVAPVDVQILENKRLLGTSQSDRIMVSAGRHELEIVNDVLGYRSIKVVQVPAGKVMAVKVDWPKGTIAVNAVPWAEVWIDGERMGETPVGNLSVPIGPHEIVFRHPELGELRHAVTVTLNTPARVSVDLRKKP